MKPRKPGRPAAVPFVLLTVALDAIGFGLIIPVEPGLVMRVGHVSGAAAAVWLGAILAAFAGAQFLAAPVLGGLSDRFGRRPVLLFSIAAQAVAALATARAPTLLLLFVIRAAAGASSGNISAASAYLADISTPEQRGRRFGLVGAMFGLGFVLGPALGGALGAVSPRLPFYARAALAAANFAYGYLVLAESLPAARRRRFDWRRANAFGALREIYLHRAGRRAAIAWACIWFAIGAQQSSFILANQMRFHWNTAENGLVLALAGAASAATQGLLTGRAQRRLGVKRTAWLGLTLSALGYLIYALAFRRWIMFAGVLVLALGALANPAIQSLFANSRDGDRQGEAQGALSALQALMMVAGPVAMGTLFTLATRHGADFPGAPFLLAAAVCAAGCVLLFGSE